MRALSGSASTVAVFADVFSGTNHVESEAEQSIALDLINCGVETRIIDVRSIV